MVTVDQRTSSRNDACAGVRLVVSSKVLTVWLHRAKPQVRCVQLRAPSTRRRLRGVLLTRDGECRLMQGSGAALWVTAWVPARQARSREMTRRDPRDYSCGDLATGSSRGSTIAARARGSPLAMDTRTSGGSRGTPYPHRYPSCTSRSAANRM